SSKFECLDLAKQVDHLSQMLRSTVRLPSTTAQSHHQIDMVKNLDRDLTLVRKCKHIGVLRHEVNQPFLPPIASNDAILMWVWAHIAMVHMGKPKDRTDPAYELASLAKDNDWNKKIIVNEGGVPLLLKLLNNNNNSNEPKSSIFVEAHISKYSYTRIAWLSIQVDEHAKSRPSIFTTEKFGFSIVTTTRLPLQ
ncbi:hypothetical protein CFP56_028300, partial [Quercus suber]